MDEADVRRLIREELRYVLRDLAWAADGSHDETIRDTADHAVREAVQSALRSLTSRDTDAGWRPTPEEVGAADAYVDANRDDRWYLRGDEAHAYAEAERIVDAAKRHGTATESAPPNPFAAAPRPKHTAQEWADKIRAVVDAAKADGHVVYADRDHGGPDGRGPALFVGTPGTPDSADAQVDL